MQRHLRIFELTDGEIRAFLLTTPLFRKQGHRSSAVKFDRIPLSAGVIEQGNVRNEKMVIKLLSAYAQQYACRSPKVYLAIPLQQGFGRAYSLPWLAKRDRKSAISLLVTEEVPIIRSDLLWDFQIISEEKAKSIQILLGAARRSLLEQYVSIFEEAGFRVEEINFAFCVWGQALGFAPQEDVLYLQGELDSLQMVLYKGTVPETVRTLIPSLSAKVGEGEVKERIDRSENEIRRYLMYYSTQHKDFNLTRLVWSGDIVVGKLAQRLLESKDVSSIEQAEITEIIDSWQKVSHRSRLNLWCQPNKERRFRRTLRRLVFLSGTLLTIGIMSCSLLYKNINSLEQEVDLLSHQGSKVLARAKEQEKLDNLWKRATIRQEKVGDELLRVCALWDSKLKIEQVTYKQAGMLLSGRTDNSGEVQSLIRKLRALGWQQPGLTSYKLTSSANVEFSLSAKQARDKDGSLIRDKAEIRQ